LLCAGAAAVTGVTAVPQTALAATTPPPTPAATTTAGRTPTKTPTLPVPRSTVQPDLSVGGEKLASMGVVTDLPAGVPGPPTLKNVSWVLADLDTGEVIAAKAPHAKLLPASTLKTLTALTLIPKVPPTKVVRPTQADANADGTRVGLVPGLPYTAKQLFQALLMSSGNDAAYALAGAGGGRAETLAEMNSIAAGLGAHDTVAKDPSGLDAPGQTSSAYDLALIGRAALQLKDFRTYVTTKQAVFPGALDAKTKKRGTYKISNHNTLLYNYPGTIGVKNGYTEAAHRTFISAVTRGGKTYLLSEMYGLDSSWRPQAAMYDWAFTYGAKARPVGRLVDPGEVPTPPTPTPTATPTTPASPASPDAAGPLGAAGAAVAPPRHTDPASPVTLTWKVHPAWVAVPAAALVLLAVWLGVWRSRRRRHRGRHRFSGA
jgi:D-alanyl-D-alanine carboxypeptidase (penicillin-binding protein 5/6)